jgi:hypothetical protein
MNGGTKVGFSTISLGRLQCARRDSAGPEERRRKKEERNAEGSKKLPDDGRLLPKHVRASI